MNQPLYKTKTFYVGLLVIAAGVVEVVFDGDWQAGVDRLLAGLAVITGRDALRKAAAA